MHENGEPTSLGTIEEVRAEELDGDYFDRQVSFPYAEGRIHGVLTNLSPTMGGGMDLIIDGKMFYVEGGTPVRVIVQTAAEAAVERRARIAEEEGA